MKKLHYSLRGLALLILVIAGFFFAKLRFFDAIPKDHSSYAISPEQRSTVRQLPEGLFDYPLINIENTLITSMEAFPNGDLLLGLRDGRLYRLKAGSKELPDAPFYVCKTAKTVEGGIIGLAISPTYSTDGYIYLNYTELADDRQEYITICRLRTDPTDPDSALPGSYQDVFRIKDELPSQIHYGGGLIFNSSGYLFVGVGDDTNSANSQDPESLRGKVLRLYPDGRIPSDNPLFTGQSEPSAVYAMGLRNPFRLVKDPRYHHIYIHDVGISKWEEVNRLQYGANYGAHILEGPISENPGITPPENYADPFLYYPHPETDPEQGYSSAIVDGLIYKGDKLPFHQMYILGNWDQLNGSLLTARLRENTEPKSKVPNPFYQTHGAVVDLVEINGEIYYSTASMDLETGFQEGLVRKIGPLVQPLPKLHIPAKEDPFAVDDSIYLNVQIEYPQIEELQVNWLLGKKIIGKGQKIITSFPEPGIYPLIVRAITPEGAYAEAASSIRIFEPYDLEVDVVILNIADNTPVTHSGSFLRITDPATGSPVLTRTKSSTFSPLPSLPLTEDNVIKRPYLSLAPIGKKILLEAMAPDMVPFGRTFSTQNLEGALKDTFYVSSRAIKLKAFSPRGEPVPGISLRFFDEGGKNLWDRIPVFQTDAEGRLYLPLPRSSPPKTVTAVISDTISSIYPGATYSCQPDDRAVQEWEIRVSTRGEALYCEPLYPNSFPVVFSEVQEVFNKYCIGCHNNLNATNQFSLTEGFSFSELFGRQSAELPGRKLLDPRTPSDSYLLEKINCLRPSFGYFMPTTSRGLIDSLERQKITNWVHNGMVGQNQLESRIFISQKEGASPLKVQFKLGVSGGKPPYSIHWDFGNGSTARSFDSEQVFVAEDQQTFRGKVVAKDSAGTEILKTFEIVVNSQKGLR